MITILAFVVNLCTVVGGAVAIVATNKAAIGALEKRIVGLDTDVKLSVNRVEREIKEQITGLRREVTDKQEAAREAQQETRNAIRDLVDENKNFLQRLTVLETKRG